VHHVALREELVPIIDGLPVDAVAQWASRENPEFPHHGWIALGGCTPGRSWWGIALVCDRCRERELAWEDERAAAGRPFILDAAKRERLRALAGTMEPFPIGWPSPR
jgi:hypothetical protein